MTANELDRYIRHYYSGVYGAALCGCRNPDDAYDIAQEVFLKLYLYNGEFSGDEHVKAWLLRCTVNKCRDLLKSHWNRFSRSLDSVEYRTTGSLYDGSGENRLLPILMKVSRKNRTALYLHYYEGYTVSEIADILKISEFAARARITRGKKQLKELLESGEYDEL